MLPPRPPSDASEEALLDRQQVQTFTLALDKAMRAQRLYGGQESAFVSRLLDNLEREMGDLLSQASITLGVASVGFTWQGRPLFTEEVEDIHLPWAFRLFCDGIREISFLKTLQWDEVLEFLDILSTNPRIEEDDLVTLLWERDFDGIRYYAADTFAAGLVVDENGDLVLASSRKVKQDSGDGVEEVTLSPSDIRLLTGEEHLSWLRLSQAPARSGGAHAWQAARLKSSLEDSADLPRFLGIALELLPPDAQVGTGAVALLVDQLEVHLARRDVDALVAFLQTTAQALVAGRRSAAALLGTLFAQERSAVLAPMLAESGDALVSVVTALVAYGDDQQLHQLLGRLPACPFQQALEAALLEQGVDLTPLYAGRLADTDATVVHAAIAALARLGTPAAVEALGGLLTHPSTEIRRAALQALEGHYHPSIRASLVRVLGDSLAGNRMLALRCLRGVTDPTITRALAEAVQDPRFEQRTLEECAAFYRALAASQDARAVAYFQRVLARRNFLRNTTTIAHQLMVARALATMTDPSARQLMATMAKAGHLPRQIRLALKNALHGKTSE